ncbi:hypothetical protein GCM10012275_11250 [Longimycelium tulufanense]|uniref:Uncharacterized protein n=1 Tax=Longimycelium tulufanense TaxID=907463 RepID=A0A8J3C8R5_9PSEU|nr:hypothetical protein [Longimycelium tulufanense]GGM42040.1 hypothetical protein GCM10012275_11250 [Longimycelium tulufanense]
MTNRTVAVCLRCGARRDTEDSLTALTWVAERSGEQTRWLCPDCARRHVRDIEGKLPTDWW